MDYNGITKDELLTLCENRGLTVSKGMKKAELIEALEDNSVYNENEMYESDSAETKAEESSSQPDIADDGSDGADDEFGVLEFDEIQEETEPEEREVDPANNDGSNNSEALTKAKKVRLKRRQKIYNDGRHSILTIDDEEKPKVLTEKERAERELIHSNADSSVVLHGQLLSVDPPVRMMLNGKSRIIVFGCVYYKGMKVYIPSNWFLPHPERIDDQDLLVTMQKRIGSEVDFSVRYINNTEEGARMKYVATRIDAMRIRRRNYWFGRKRKNGEVIFRINEGDIVEARVVAVTTKDITVDVFGAETRIFATELSYEYLQDARERFNAGDRINVAITAIERDLSGESLNKKNGTYEVDFSASVKATKEDPRKVFFDDYEPNQTCRGIVTKVIADESLRFFVNVAGEIDVLCWMKEGVTLLPEEGDVVSIKIARKYDDNKFITGTITHVNTKRYF